MSGNEKRKKAPSRARKQTEVENINVLGIHFKMSPVSLRVYADDFVSAARSAPKPKSPKFQPARLYLVCHAIELTLKAFLSLRGFSLQALSDSQLGHDLRKLLSQAREHGLLGMVDLPTEMLAEIERASEYYSEKVFEYPALVEAVTGMSRLPDFSTLLAAATCLVSKLEDPCLGEALR
jgi:hypothetical protein